MSAPPFVFALRLTGHVRECDMLNEVARSVFRHAGYPAEAITELADLVRQAFVDGRGPCDVRFEAIAGELRVVVSPRQGREWQTRRPLP